jgi:hypothetical protein
VSSIYQSKRNHTSRERGLIQALSGGIRVENHYLRGGLPRGEFESFNNDSSIGYKFTVHCGNKKDAAGCVLVRETKYIERGNLLATQSRHLRTYQSNTIPDNIFTLLHLVMGLPNLVEGINLTQAGVDLSIVNQMVVGLCLFIIAAM